MNKKNISSGRVRQKMKTRNRIIVTAQELMKTKKELSLDRVADKAGISRATVYRYFSNIDLLITEASLDIHHKDPDELLESTKDMDLRDRLLHIQEYYNRLAATHESGFRLYLATVLKSSVNTRKKLRGARRPESFRKALESDGISKADMEKLVQASTLLSGIDARVVCKDVLSLSEAETKSLLHWCLASLIDSVLVKK